MRPDPYVDEWGEGRSDDDARFAAFSAAVAALARDLDVDLVQLNDWHTALTPAFLDDGPPTVMTIHNLAHQGWAGADWLPRLPSHRDAYAWGDGINGLGGAIRVADRVVAVSPDDAADITTAAAGMGVQGVLAGPGGTVRRPPPRGTHRLITRIVDRVGDLRPRATTSPTRPRWARACRGDASGQARRQPSTVFLATATTPPSETVKRSRSTS